MENQVISAVAATGEVSLFVNGMLWMTMHPVAKDFWHRQKWFVKPFSLMGLTAVGGAVTALAHGMDPKTAVVTSMVGLFSAIMGPAWKPIWEEAQAEQLEERNEK